MIQEPLFALPEILERFDHLLFSRIGSRSPAALKLGHGATAIS